MNGPNQILPSGSITSTVLGVPVKIRSIDLESQPPVSVPGMFDFVCDKYPNRVALCRKYQGKWQCITYRKYKQLVQTCAKAFISLGLTPNSVVCIIGFNSPEWFVADIGAIYAGGVAAGLYTTNSPEACLYCLSHSKAKIVVVEDQAQLAKILEVKGKVPELRAVVQYSGEVTAPGVLSWQALLDLGRTVDNAILDRAVRSVGINQCCTLVYTSGTTGNPKGAMLSHDNILYDAVKIGRKLGLRSSPPEVYVSYLPLSHVAGNVVDIHCTYVHGTKVYFAERDALKGSLVGTFVEVQPTRILSVPRVWEKIYEKLQEVAAKNKGIKKKIAKWGKSEGLKKNKAREQKRGYCGCYCCANMVVFRTVKRKLGIGRCRTIISGAAPLAPDVKYYFASLDILIMDAFGMSECSAMHSCNVPENFRFESCGMPCPGMLTVIDKPDADGQGELCILGRHVFMGYLNDPAKTAEAIDAAGYLHSGDVAKIDGKGYLSITGRIKELLITAGGENVAPVLIEQQVKAALPFVGYAVVIGDRKKFLIVLLTLSCEVNDKGESTEQLTPLVKSWLNKLGFANITNMSQFLATGPNKKILDSIQDGINAANKQAISNAQKIQKFAILPKDFSIPTGELTPTMKVKRNVVAEKYQPVIDKVYADASRDM